MAVQSDTDALLPQPGGFEGFAAVAVADLTANDPAAMEREYIGYGLVDFDPAAPSFGDPTTDRDDSITGVDELIRLHSELSPHLVPFGEHGPNALYPGVGLRIDDPSRGVEDYARVEERNNSFKRNNSLLLVAIPGLDQPAHDLDVLLRHRQRSIALCREQAA
jgi:hypothetical protein